MLYVHKYMPKNESDFIFNKKIVNLLNNFVKKSEIVNTIISGVSGSGKYSIANYMINSNFDMNNICYKMKDSKYISNDIELNINKSPYHYEIDANDNNFNDKRITINFIQEISSTTDVSNNLYKIIIIKNAENLSTDAQIILTKLLELYGKSCRIIFICHNLSKMITKLKSRCLLININAPSDVEIKLTLKNIINNEKLTISPKNLNKIITTSNNNINIAIFLLQRFMCGNELLNNNISVFINNVCHTIFNYRSDPKVIRESIFNILIYDINISVLLTRIIDIIYEQKYTSEIRFKITQAISYYHSNITKGYKQIYHYEALIFYIINTLKKINTKLLIEHI